MTFSYLGTRASSILFALSGLGGLAPENPLTAGDLARQPGPTPLADGATDGRSRLQGPETVGTDAAPRSNVRLSSSGRVHGRGQLEGATGRRGSIATRLAELAAEAKRGGQPGRAPTEPTASAQALSTRLEQALGDAAGGLDLGVTVRSIGNPDPLFDFAGDRALNPASNHKLLVATAALELLGPAYRFVTRVFVEGDALVLVGSGDPSLQVPDLTELAMRVRALAAAGQVDLTQIRHIVVDDSLFSPSRFGPGYDRDGYGPSYMAPSGALSVQWNTVEVTVRPTRRGQPLRVTVQPASAQVEVRVHGTTGRGRRVAVTSRRQGERTIIDVRGRLRPGAPAQRVRRRIHDPGRFTAAVFLEQLATVGDAADAGATKAAVRNWSVQRGKLGAYAQLLATHHSQALPQVLESALKYSNNFTAEQLLRVLGHEHSGQRGDWANGREVLEAFWRATGHDPNGLVFENASGYSPEGRLSARALADLLAWTQRPDSRCAMLLSSLAVAGRDGTLRHRLADSDGRVLGKTGTLDQASALSGVVLTPTGAPRFAFSVLVNGPTPGLRAHALQDRLVRVLLDGA